MSADRLKDRIALARQTEALSPFRAFELGVAMRDGIILAVDVYLPPAGQLPAPVLITPHTGYDKSQLVNAVTARFWNQRGYAFVIADARGRGKSEGERDPANGWGLGADGHDLIEWVAAQQWSNGQIGGTGTSWHAAAQVTAALERPPHLRCIVPAAPGAAFRRSGMFRETHYENGCFTLSVRAAASARTAGRVQNVPAVDFSEALHMLPLGKLTDVIRNPLLAQFLEHDRLDDWWLAQQVDGRGHDIEVPALHIVGWFDVPCRRGTLKGYEETMRVSSAKDQQWLIVGPWTHAIGSRCYEVDGRDFGPEADFDIAEASIAFYDHFLKGIDNGWEQTPRVRLFETGSNVWRCVDQWPPRARGCDLHLRPDGRLSGKQAPDGIRQYRYDPLAPPEWLVWETAPLAQELAVSGWPRVHLLASTDGEDTDWHVRLSDVDHEGKVYDVAAGRMRASYSASLSAPEPLMPDQVYAYELELTALTHAFLPGHRLRFSLASSDFPTYARSLNRFGKYRDQAEPRVAVNTVYHGATFPSRLELPIVRGSFHGEGES